MGMRCEEMKSKGKGKWKTECGKEGINSVGKIKAPTYAGASEGYLLEFS